MRLLEIQTRNWRGLTVELTDLSPRLNLVVGQNQAGKSRLREAIQYGLFESSKGSSEHKRRLQGWFDTSAPSVRLKLEHDGQEYEIEKTFLKSASTRLTTAHKTWSGEEAEAEVARLLGTAPGGTKPVQGSALGIWPLLILRQGDSLGSASEDLNDESRKTLTDRISKEIGLAAVTPESQKLLALSRAMYVNYYTANSGSETGVLRAARAALAQADTDLAKAKLEYDQQIALAADVAHAEQKEKERESALRQLEKSLADAEQRRDAAAAARDNLSRAQSALADATRLREGAEDALKGRIKREDERDEVKASVASLETEWAALNEAVEVAQQAVSAATATALRAREEEQKAAMAARRASALAELAVLRNQASTLTGVIRNLEEFESEINALSVERATMRVDAAALKRLLTLEREQRESNAKLQGAAVRVRITASAALKVDGKTVEPGSSLDYQVVDNQVIAIGESATLEVFPGAGEIALLREAATRARGALAEALAKLGLASVAEAENRKQRLDAIEASLAQLRTRATDLSPKPVTELKIESQALDKRIAEMSLELGPGGPAPDIRQIQAEHQRLSALANESIIAERDANNRLREHQTRKADTESRRAAASTRLSIVEATLEAMPSRESLTEGLLAARTGEQESSAGVESAKAQFEAAGGNAALADVARFETAVKSMRQQHSDALREHQQRLGALNELMRQKKGRYESAAEAEAAQADAKTRFDRILREAEAAKALKEALEAAHGRVVATIKAPIISRIRPYLQLMFPGSELNTEDDLSITGLRINGVDADFAELSGGAREQLSMLVRIALADLIAGPDGTVPLILDDALVNSDAGRISQMQSILYQAGRKLQVMILSCHEPMYNALGADKVVSLG